MKTLRDTHKGENGMKSSKDLKSAKRTPIGIIELETGPRAVYPMEDFFLNYTYNKPEHWEALRLTANIFIEDYQSKIEETMLATIKGAIKVITQYAFYTGAIKSSKSQDFKMDEDDDNVTFIEFQNRANTKPPIEFRAPEYLGLSLGHNRGKNITQMWIMAEDLESVMHNNPYSNYVLRDEVTNKVFPRTSNLVFISLKSLANENTVAGELARYLLGMEETPQNEAVKKIAATFSASFGKLKDDKEAKTHMTLREKYVDEGIEIGREEGREEGMTQKALQTAIKLLKRGLNPKEVAEDVELPLEMVENLSY